MTARDERNAARWKIIQAVNNAALRHPRTPKPPTLLGMNRVVLFDGGGQCAGWLSRRLDLVNVAWEAGDWTWAEAKTLAGHARRTIPVPAWCRWHPVPVVSGAVTS